MMGLRQQAGLFGVAVLVFAATGCVTTPSKPDFKASEVIERQSGVDETPAWVKAEEAITEHGGDVIYKSEMSMNGNARTEACLKGAELDARAGFLRHIKESLTTSGQLNETDATSDPAVEGLTAYLSQGNLSGAKTTHRFWQKTEESDANSGERVLRLHCYVQVAISKSVLQKQMQAALGSGGNKEIHDKLIDAQNQFLDSVGTADAEKAAH